MGLLDDDKEYIEAIKETNHWGSGTFLRRMFSTLMASDQLTRPEIVWKSTSDLLIDDILYRQRRLLGAPDLRLTNEQLIQYALADIEMMLHSCGTGKTFIWRAMSAALRSKGEIVLTVSSSGITALLIPGGRTTHSRFGIPLNVDEVSTCSIVPKSPLASLIQKAKLIIWDEAPMMHKYCFEAVDRTLKDILKSVDEKNKHISFSGKVVVFDGDFRQILPVIPKGTRPEVVHATINSSVLWKFCEVLTLSKNMRLLSGATSADVEQRRLFSEWVLGVGDGEIGDERELDIPSDLQIPNSCDPLASIVESTYPHLLQNMKDITYFQNRAILAPKNSVVDTINDYILDLIPGEEKTYLSYDTPLAQDVNGH